MTEWQRKKNGEKLSCFHYFTNFSLTFFQLNFYVPCQHAIREVAAHRLFFALLPLPLSCNL
jgi:hypothetical protein